MSGTVLSGFFGTILSGTVLSGNILLFGTVLSGTVLSGTFLSVHRYLVKNLHEAFKIMVFSGKQLHQRSYKRSSTLSQCVKKQKHLSKDICSIFEVNFNT